MLYTLHELDQKGIHEQTLPKIQMFYRLYEPGQKGIQVNEEKSFTTSHYLIVYTFWLLFNMKKYKQIMQYST